MHYAIALCVGFWGIVAGVLVCAWGGWWSGGALIVGGLLLIGMTLRRAMDEPDEYEQDEHATSL